MFVPTFSPSPQPAPSIAAPSFAVAAPGFASQRLQSPLPSGPAPAPRSAVRFALPPLRRPGAPNRTGLPDRFKEGLEQTSGLDLSDIRVHRNSSRPRQLGALAYARGSEIHLGPGQEMALPHEVWHVVQQKQGRVRPTLFENGTAINDDRHLEAEATSMGQKAVRSKALPWPGPAKPLQIKSMGAQRVVQRATFLQYHDVVPAATPIIRLVTLAPPSIIWRRPG